MAVRGPPGFSLPQLARKVLGPVGRGDGRAARPPRRKTWIDPYCRWTQSSHVGHVGTAVTGVVPARQARLHDRLMPALRHGNAP
jgi:hypothetical protein